MNHHDRLNLFHWTEREYNRILGFLRKNKKREKMAALIVRGLPPLFFAVYTVQLCLMGWWTIVSGFAPKNLSALIGSMVFPAGCLLMSIFLRKKIDRKRPYEQLSIRPLLDKKGGKSFPSNHTASAFVLALTTFRLSAVLGCIMLLLAIITGMSRIAAGLHWPEDVLCGGILGLVFGILGLLIL